MGVAREGGTFCFAGLVFFGECGTIYPLLKWNGICSVVAKKNFAEGLTDTR